jgi:hypothetical protein
VLTTICVTLRARLVGRGLCSTVLEFQFDSGEIRIDRFVQQAHLHG